MQRNSTRGQFLVHFFRGKFRGISWKMIFQNFFCGKFHFLATFFFLGGGEFSAEFSPKFSPEKMNEKLAPDLEKLMTEPEKIMPRSRETVGRS
jgi:hypothetical protein